MPSSSNTDSVRIRHVQGFTISWMIVEASVSLLVAWRARSPALLAFGGESAIELISAVVVLRRFDQDITDEVAERRYARISGVFLFALATYVVIASAMGLLGYIETGTSTIGIVVLISAAIVMPWLAKVKRGLSTATGSRSLRADAAQSATCAYLSVIALVGIGINSIWHITWADPIAALGIVPFLVLEGRESLRGQACGCR